MLTPHLSHRVHVWLRAALTVAVRSYMTRRHTRYVAHTEDLFAVTRQQVRRICLVYTLTNDLLLSKARAKHKDNATARAL